MFLMTICRVSPYSLIEHLDPEAASRDVALNKQIADIVEHKKSLKLNLNGVNVYHLICF